jgi:Phosphotransferase enzyme family
MHLSMAIPKEFVGGTYYSSIRPQSAQSRRFNMNYETFQTIIRRVLPRSSIASIKDLGTGGVHQVYLLTLCEDIRLVLRVAPTPYTRALQYERDSLQNQKDVLTILGEENSLPIPRVLHYESCNTTLGSATLLTTYIPGFTLKDLKHTLSAYEQFSLNRQLGIYTRLLNNHRAPTFGTVSKVLDGTGFTSWRDAFLSLLESILRDAENVVILLPYDQIREQMERLSGYLDDITVPRLVAFDLCETENAVLDPSSGTVRGLLGFRRCLFGDPMIAGYFGEDSGISEGFSDGYGECPARIGREKVRSSL